MGSRIDIYNQPPVYTSDRNNNRNKVNDWNLSSVDHLDKGNGRGRERLSPAGAKIKRSHTS